MSPPKQLHYILDDNNVPIKTDLMTWAKYFKEADRVVAQTTIDKETEVSTVFLGMDHQFGDGPPLLFETLVFGGEHDGDMWRYSTWEEAETGHKEVVERLLRIAIKSRALST